MENAAFEVMEEKNEGKMEDGVDDAEEEISTEKDEGTKRKRGRPTKNKKQENKAEEKNGIR